MIQVLSWRDRDLAEMFAGTAPAPGGAFAHGQFEQTTWGPRLVSATSWAYATRVEEAEVGWSVLLTCRVEEAGVATRPNPPSATGAVGSSR